MREFTDTNEQLWDELRNWAGDDGAIQESFALGIPAYYADPDTPRDLNVKAYPDGHRELVRYVSRGVEEVVDSL